MTEQALRPSLQRLLIDGERAEERGAPGRPLDAGRR
jgi:hypothetical protein